MPYTKEYLGRIEETLSQVVPIRTKSMFGGVGIYSGDLFFAVIDNDRLYFKVDDASRPNYAEHGMGPFIYDPASPPMMGYFELPSFVLESVDDLRSWVDVSLGVAERAASKKKPRLPNP